MQSWAIGTTSEHLNTYTHKYMCIVMPVKVLESSCTLEVSNETLCLGLGGIEQYSTTIFLYPI